MHRFADGDYVGGGNVRAQQARQFGITDFFRRCAELRNAGERAEHRRAQKKRKKGGE